jgi:hypothetical protein
LTSTTRSPPPTGFNAPNCACPRGLPSRAASC